MMQKQMKRETLPALGRGSTRLTVGRQAVHKAIESQ